jgi:hypothetical protein
VAAQNLRFLAGPAALDSIRRHGFGAGSIGTIAGASGGAKWLVLSQLDRVVLKTLLPRLQGPVHLISSSIGAWRFACYAQADPLAAIDRFEEAYIGQTFSEKPDIHEITRKSREILDIVLGDSGPAEVLDHAVFRSHIMTVRSRGPAASENTLLLAASLLAAASLNVISRRTLGVFFERALFFDARDLPPVFMVEGFPIQKVRLRRENLKDVVVASGSIPLVLSGVRDIDGANPGVYRDGGVIDYHLDLPHSDPDRFTFFPHFYDHIVPGWFDKKLSWRKPAPENIDRTILVSPSAGFVAGLPRAKIPDRTDFTTYSPDDRMRAWRSVVASCEALAGELHDVIEKDQLPARLEPL